MRAFPRTHRFHQIGRSFHRLTLFIPLRFALPSVMSSLPSFLPSFLLFFHTRARFLPDGHPLVSSVRPSGRESSARAISPTSPLGVKTSDILELGQLDRQTSLPGPSGSTRRASTVQARLPVPGPRLLPNFPLGVPVWSTHCMHTFTIGRRERNYGNEHVHVEPRNPHAW